MKKNLGNIDRGIRVLIAIVIAILYFTHVISSTLAIVLLVVAGIFVVTSFLSFCPIYYTLGLSTRKKQNDAK
jgi:hypothetical protein